MDEVEAFARARKRKVRVRLFLMGAIVAAPFLYLGWRWHSISAAEEDRAEARRKELALSGAERTELRGAIEAARKMLVGAREAWGRAVTPEALAEVGQGAGRCGVRVVGPTAQAAASYSRYGSIDANYFGNVFYRPHAVGASIPPLDIDAELKGLTAVAAELEAGKADHNDLSRVRNLDDTALFVVVEQERKPSVHGIGEAQSYTPGRIVGTAYVYSYRQQRIICVGPLDASNGSSIEFDYQYISDSFSDKEDRMREAAMATLRRDLEVHVQQALAQRLRVAAPAAAGGAGGEDGADGEDDAAGTKP